MSYGSPQDRQHRYSYQSDQRLKRQPTCRRVGLQEVLQMPCIDRLHDWYDFDAKALGAGAFVRVYKAVHKETGDECAVKVLKNTSFPTWRRRAESQEEMK